MQTHSQPTSSSNQFNQHERKYLLNRERHIPKWHTSHKDKWKLLQHTLTSKFPDVTRLKQGIDIIRTIINQGKAITMAEIYYTPTNNKFQKIIQINNIKQRLKLIEKELEKLNKYTHLQYRQLDQNIQLHCKETQIDLKNITYQIYLIAKK